MQRAVTQPTGSGPPSFDSRCRAGLRLTPGYPGPQAPGGVIIPSRTRGRPLPAWR